MSSISVSPSAAAVGALATAGLAASAVALLRRAQRAEAELAEVAARRNELGLQLMGLRNKYMHTGLSTQKGRTMVARKSDVFIVTYPKCGTTWMTQICHALRTRGDMNFGEITEVVPWDILAHDCGQDLNAEQVANPRLFKSHEPWDVIPKGGKYIYIARNPLDAFVSFYKFLPSYMALETSDIDEEAFARAIFAGAAHSGQIWDHFLGWWQQRRNPNVLWVFFEDLSRDLRHQVMRVARFIGADVNDASLIEDVLRKASFDFMASKENVHHFDDHFVRAGVLQRIHLPADTPQRIGKVRRDGGKVGTRKALPLSVQQRLDNKWAATLRAPTGCANYEEFHKSMRDEKLLD